MWWKNIYILTSFVGGPEVNTNHRCEKMYLVKQSTIFSLKKITVMHKKYPRRWNPDKLEFPLNICLHLVALTFFFLWWWMLFFFFFYDRYFYQRTAEASVLIYFILYIFCTCVLHFKHGEVSKAPTRWISLSLLSRSLPCIFHLNSKHVILPTDAHPLFPLAYQELQ